MDNQYIENLDKDRSNASGDLAGAFFLWMEEWARDANLSPDAPIVVAVSGGVDSMALTHLLWRWTRQTGHKLLALTVDHGLRAEAVMEAVKVGEFVKSLGGASYKTLIWQHEQKPSSRLQEEAREARYELMAQEMQEAGAKFLFTAHHQGDQAETFLFRLAKGSGLDGLAGMAEQQEFAKGLILCRPLLDVPKAELIAYCEQNNIPVMHDPSNDQERFARVRLRKSMDVLEEEGLSEKRLAQTARRMARARKALEILAKQSYEKAILTKEPNSIVFDFNILKELQEEIVFRIINLAVKDMGGSSKYGVRMEKIENLLDDLLKPFPFRKRTLGKMVFERDDKRGHFIVSAEEKS